MLERNTRASLGLGIGILGCLFALPNFECRGGVFALFDYGFHHNGNIIGYGEALPSGGSFDTVTGLGSVIFDVTAPGSHSVLLFLDHEFSEATNTSYNELGEVSSTSPPAGLSWEIDEPGYLFGDIFDHFLFNALDNTVGTTSPEDVSMSLGWDFEVVDGQRARVRFDVSASDPQGFNLSHFDPDSGERIYFTSSLLITAVPEWNGQVLVTGIALGGLAWIRRKRKAPSRAANPETHTGKEVLP